MQYESALFSTRVANSLPYRLYVPDDLNDNPNRTYPLLLYLHGAGERGNDLDRVASIGLPADIERGKSIPFIVLAPQCPQSELWTHYAPTLIAMLDSTMQRYPIDRERVYITGLSMGGMGTWYLTSSYPERFAAAAPICGFGHALLGYPERLRRMLHIPVWAFHGEADDVVPMAAHKEIVDVFKAYGGSVKWTTYPGVKHNSWDKAYATDDLYTWFLQHKISS